MIGECPPYFDLLQRACQCCISNWTLMSRPGCSTGDGPASGSFSCSDLSEQHTKNDGMNLPNAKLVVLPNAPHKNSQKRSFFSALKIFMIVNITCWIFVLNSCTYLEISDRRSLSCQQAMPLTRWKLSGVYRPPLLCK